MLGTIKSFFDNNLSTELDKAKPVDRILLATAALLFEVCRADSSIDQSETQKIANIFKSRYLLSQQDLDQLIQLAEAEALQATSLYQFTALINDEYSHREKRLVIRNMWEVAYADGDLDKYEEHLIRKVADLLYLNHSDFIKAKLEVRDSILPDSED